MIYANGCKEKFIWNKKVQNRAKQVKDCSIFPTISNEMYKETAEFVDVFFTGDMNN